jgi:hypothetical protein
MPGCRTIRLATGSVTLAAAAALTTGLVASSASGGSDSLSQVRHATAGYRDVDRAIPAGAHHDWNPRVLWRPAPQVIPDVPRRSGRA